MCSPLQAFDCQLGNSMGLSTFMRWAECRWMPLSTIVGIGPFLSIAHNMVPPHWKTSMRMWNSEKYSFEYLTNTVYKIRVMGLNDVVNNCWNWTIPVNCAQYGSASLKNLNVHEKYSFEYLTNTVYKIRVIGLNAVVNNCWNWTIPVNCAQYGSASFMLDISEWG